MISPAPIPCRKRKNSSAAEARRRGAQQKSNRAPGQPGAEHAGVSPDVADPPEGEHQPGMGQHIADHDPLDHRDRQAEAAGDIGEGDVYRGVERHDRDAETERHETQQRRRSGGRGLLLFQDHADARPFLVRTFIGGEEAATEAERAFRSMRYCLAWPWRFRHIRRCSDFYRHGLSDNASAGDAGPRSPLIRCMLPLTRCVMLTE